MGATHSQLGIRLRGGGHSWPGHPQGGKLLRLGPARKGGRRHPQGIAACKGDACGQKCRPQGLLPAASRGSARPRPIRRMAAPVEVPPTGAEPAALWQGDYQWARQHRRRKGGKGFEVTLPELLNMLREAESTIKKEKS
ncbi:hypothetical protein BHM03_00020661 [Ensete ventricosum]|nr:hypothetical protein BHM03_00020661 [Ensete ventricosum]